MGFFFWGGGVVRFWVAPNVMGAARLDIAKRRKDSALNQATEDPVVDKTMPSSGLF